MLIIKHTVETTASKEAVWNIWTDVKNYHTWDYSTEYASLDGAFKEGAIGSWKGKDGPVLQMKLTQVEPLKVFVSEFKLFLASIVAYHYLSESAGKTQVIEQIEITGPLAFLFAYHAGQKIKKNLPQEMNALVKKAESLK